MRAIWALCSSFQTNKYFTDLPVISAKIQPFNDPIILHLSKPGGMRGAIRRPSGWRARLLFRLLSSFLDSSSLFWLLNPSYNPPQGLSTFRRVPSSSRPGAIFFCVFYLDVFWPAFGMPFALFLAVFWPPKWSKMEVKMINNRYIVVFFLQLTF